MGKYDKYIITKLYKREELPGPTPKQRDILADEGWRIGMEHTLWVDSDVIPGAYYGESTWIWPRSYPHQIDPAALNKRFDNAKPMFPHAHDFPELLSWWGTDPDHPEDTGSMGMIMDDEEIQLDRSWLCYIPAGMPHMPTRGQAGGKMATKPVLHWTAGPGAYTREADEKTKEAAHKKDAIPPAPKADIKRGPNLKNAKYFVYDYKKGVKRADYMKVTDTKYTRPVNYIDNSIIPSAEFGCDNWWLLPGDKSKSGHLIMDKRTLNHGTTINLTTMNYDDITDLCAEAELWIGGEKHIINKAFGAFIPQGVEAGPFIVRDVKQQMFLEFAYPIGDGIKKYKGG
jgi:hypothetical protein